MSDDARAKPVVASDPADALAAARAAALNRSGGASTSVLPSKEDKEIKEFRLKLLKIVDDEMMGAYKRPQALAAMELLQILLKNALDDETKRSVRLSNPAFLKRVGDRRLLDGPFVLYLHECGFRHEVIDFEAKRTFPAQPRPDQLQKLVIGEAVVRTRRAVILESYESYEKAKNADKEAENARTHIAKRHIEDDRASVRARVEREQAAARARITGDDAAPPPYQ